ncbi:MAG: hypothetical protein AB7V14_10160, partial [Kiritimatiellia bacterium]
LGQDEFNGATLDVPMARNETTGQWEASFTAPDSPKWCLAFCFFDSGNHVWHNNHAQNWRALVAREE